MKEKRSKTTFEIAYRLRIVRGKEALLNLISQTKRTSAAARGSLRLHIRSRTSGALVAANRRSAESSPSCGHRQSGGMDPGLTSSSTAGSVSPGASSGGKQRGRTTQENRRSSMAWTPSCRAAVSSWHLGGTVGWWAGRASGWSCHTWLGCSSHGSRRLASGPK